MKEWLMIVGVVFSFSAWAEDGPVVTVFSRDIHLSSECKVNARPSVLNSEVYYTCSEMSVRFKKAGTVDTEYLGNQDIIEHVKEGSIEGRKHYLIESRYGETPQYIYVICDDELCMSIISLSTDAIESVARQVSSEVLHNKAAQADAAEPRGWP